MAPPAAASDAPSTAAAPNQNVQRLNAVIEEAAALRRELQKVHQEFKKHREAVSTAVHVLREEIKTLSSTNSVRLAFIEEELGIEEEGEPGEAGMEQPAGDEEGGAQPAKDGPSMNAVEASETARDSDSIKSVVNDTFKILLGVEFIAKKHLPAYPGAGDAWPTDRSTGKELVRFDWYKTPKHAVNEKACKEVFNSIRATGAQRVPDAIENLGIILDAHLMQRIHTKLSYLSTQYKQYHGKRQATHNLAAEQPEANDGFQEGQEEDGAGGVAEADDEARDVDVEQRLDRGIRRTRAKKKLEARVRKRVGSEYMDTKYDSAFIVNAMSDDEDEFPDDETPAGQAKRYVSRAPDYWSDIAQGLYDAIDARADPNPDRARLLTERIRGESLAGTKPPQAKTLAARIRAWQVKVEILEQNVHWYEDGRVAKSGVAWGDAEDPKEVTGGGKRKGRGVRGGGMKVKRPRIDRHIDVESSQARIAEMTGDVDPELIFEQL